MKMTVCIQKRDRCRICYSLILRDRTTLYSSICCQKYYNIFQNIQRTKIPLNKYSPYKVKLSKRTVCFQNLIIRYLRAQISPIKNYSNYICYDCSMTLLDIEQCAKYLRKTINQLKMKYNKSNRLITSSLSATFQKKIQTTKTEQLPLLVSDEDDEFEEMDDEEESDDEQVDEDANINISNRTKFPNFNSSSLLVDRSVKTMPRMKINNSNFNDDDDDDECNDEDSDGVGDDDDVEGENTSVTNGSNLTHNIQRNKNLSSINQLPLKRNSSNNTNPNNILPLDFAHILKKAAEFPLPVIGQNTDMNAVVHTFNNIQQNFIKMFADPIGATNLISAAQTKANPLSMTSINKQIEMGSGNGRERKRKSQPEKRVVRNHSLSTNNGNTSPSTEDGGNNERPLELTMKSESSINRTSPSTNIQNFSINSKDETHIAQLYQSLDEDNKSSMTPNDSSASFSSPANHRSTSSKRLRLSNNAQYEQTSANNSVSGVNLTQTSNDLLLSNHNQTNANGDANTNRQQRKLDPRTCAECGKVLFNEKTHLLHCQTHARNAKQCWICGVNDNDIKKHILNEHGNQQFTNSGFKCQHCERVYPVYADLEAHTKEHSKKKPFECLICHKRFGQQGNLSCHLRIHSGVKPFNCQYCGKAFRHSNSLRRHSRTVHSASRGLTASTTNSLLVSNSGTSLSHDIKSDTFDDAPSALMIPSDDEASSEGIPSPSVSNAQVDSDSHEQFGTT